MAAASQATATAIALEDKNIAIPIKPRLKEEDYVEATLVRMVGAEKKKAVLPKIIQKDPELICKAILEFQDVRRPGRLQLNTNALLNEKFREMLGGIYRTKFDELRANNPATIPGFDTTVEQFIAFYIEDTALANEQSYLETYRKLYRTTPDELSERLLEINRLMAIFPGAGGVVPYNQQQLKHCFYKMMPPSWQVRFATNVDRLTDPNYTFKQLVSYMNNQDTADNIRNERRFGMRGGPGRGYGRRRRAAERFNRYEERPRQYRRFNRAGFGRGGYQQQSNQQYQIQRYQPGQNSGGNSWSRGNQMRAGGGRFSYGRGRGRFNNYSRGRGWQDQYQPGRGFNGGQQQQTAPDGHYFGPVTDPKGHSEQQQQPQEGRGEEQHNYTTSDTHWLDGFGWQ